MFPTRPKISVCLATYNGARFVAEQLTSILVQLDTHDEVIVVDDCSGDKTVQIVEAIQDHRIRILQNSRNLGVVATFERALEESCGEILFLSDQDDLWLENKVERILHEFRDPSITLVVSAAHIIGPEGVPDLGTVYRRLKKPPQVMSTILKNQYQGSLMAFRRSILSVILPFPKKIAMHDWWIAVVNGIVGRAATIQDPLVYYRRHGNNVTSLRRGNLSAMITNRIWLLLSVIRRYPKLLGRRTPRP